MRIQGSRSTEGHGQGHRTSKWTDGNPNVGQLTPTPCSAWAPVSLSSFTCKMKGLGWLPCQLFRFMTWYSVMTGAGFKLFQRPSACQIIIKLAVSSEVQWTIPCPCLRTSPTSKPCLRMATACFQGFREPIGGLAPSHVIPHAARKETPAFQNTSARSFLLPPNPLLDDSITVIYFNWEVYQSPFAKASGHLLFDFLPENAQLASNN